VEFILELVLLWKDFPYFIDFYLGTYQWNLLISLLLLSFCVICNYCYSSSLICYMFLYFISINRFYKFLSNS